MILAGEEEVLLGLCVVVSLAFLFANALVFYGYYGYLTSRGSGRGCASAM
jgi:hypothetical protein